MGQKCAIFKICPKFAQKDFYMNRVPSPPFLGIVSNKKWSPFLDFGIRSPFFHPKTAIFSDFGCKKMGLGMPKSKNGDHFLSPTIPKNGGIDSCFTRISFSGEFWAYFENRVF